MSDMDGCCSAAMQYMFLTNICELECKVFTHSSKQHGLRDVVDDIINSECQLCWIADAGTNDIDDCAKIKDNSIDIIITDHHDMLCDNPYAVVVNNQLGNVNKALSGTGVTYQLIKAYNEKTVDEYQYMDLVALSIVSDVCDLRSYENRAFVHYGLNNITNPFIKLLFDKECKQRGRTPEAIGWCIAPLANALARMDDQDAKRLFFDALIGCIDAEEALKKMKSIKRKQDENVRLVVNEIEPTIDLNHKAIIGFTQPENKGFIGLIANKMLGKYGKPTILLRELNSTTWTGSLRAPIDMADLINETKLAECMGHQAACGITIKKANLRRFAKWIDTLDLDVEPEINVTATIATSDISLELAQVIEDNAELWGKGIECPTFYIVLDHPELYVYKNRITTLKLVQDGIDFIKFFADEKMIDAISNRGNQAIELICKIKTNEYEGVISPQMMIEDWALIVEEEKEYDWEDIFK